MKGGGGPCFVGSASFVPLAPDLDRKQPSRAQTPAGQLKVQGGQTPQRLTNSFLMTLLTPAMGNTRSRGTKTTAPQLPLKPLLSSHFSPSSQELPYDHKVCKHMPPLFRSPPHGFLLLCWRRKAQRREGERVREKKHSCSCTLASNNSRLKPPPSLEVHTGLFPVFRAVR